MYDGSGGPNLSVVIRCNVPPLIVRRYDFAAHREDRPAILRAVDASGTIPPSNLRNSVVSDGANQ
jgi:hypothetical protein